MQLVVQTGAEPGRTYDVANHKVVVGRQSGNDVVVPDEQVSRKHAEIEERGGNLIVTDLNSSNGTFVNGTRISSPQTLRSGDTVQIGTTVLKVVDSPNNASTIPSGYQSAAPDGFAEQGYSSGPPGSTRDYGQFQSYGQQGQGYNPPQPSAQPDYGQGYNQPQSYGQPPAAQPQADYGQAQNYAQPQGQAQGYGQPQPDYNQPQGYAQPQGYDYGGQQVAYGQPPAPTGSPAAKKSSLLPILIGVGALLLVLVIVLVFFLVSSSGSGVVGDLPAPKTGTKLDFASQDFDKFTQLSGQKIDTSKLKYAAYTTSESSDALLSFYRDEMKKKGWTEDATRSSSTGPVFTKGDQSAAIAILPVKDSQTLAGVNIIVPSAKDKIKVGDTFLLLLQGPTDAVKGTTRT